MQSIAEKIKQRRRQILVHSFIYYELDSNIVDDNTWAKWAKELVKLQDENPKEAAKVEYAEQFKDFDGSTGAFFTYDDKIKSIAYRLYCKEWGLDMKISQNTEKSTPKREKISKTATKTAKKKKTSSKRLF